MKWKPYTGYRYSGIEWLGDIPESWKPLPFKRLGRFRAGSGFPDAKQGFVDEEIPFYKVSDMNLEGNEIFMSRHNNSVSRKTAHALRAFIFPPGTIIFAKVGAALLLNKRRILASEACVDNNTMGFMREGCDLKWAYYWMCNLDLANLANPGAVPSVNEGQICETPVALPPPDDQCAIGRFLDRETERIDALIEKKERQIELLEEKRAALISHAVTKGLDPNAKMKDSDVQWLDMQPVGWKRMPLKRWVQIKITDGPHETPELLDEGVDFISAEAIQEARINFGARRGCISVELHDRYCRKCRPRKNDIFLCKSGATTGKAALVESDREFSVWSPLAQIRADSRKILPGFLFLAIQSDYIQNQIRTTWSAGTQPNISMGAIEEISVIAPPVVEQNEILLQVQDRLRTHDDLVARIRRSIDYLQEYRTALITAAVTGKIDVREEVA